MTALKISPAFSYDVQIEGTPADLRDAVAQSQYYLENDKLGRLVVGHGAISSKAVKLLGTCSEQYALTITADGSAATLTANSSLGLYRRLTTFNQIFYYYGDVIYTLLALNGKRLRSKYCRVGSSREPSSSQTLCSGASSTPSESRTTSSP
ncbi:hypothetical protein DEU56DRAFT_822542 [Suillus clintonianus]|uniref:uncharacterized protein n=1 Tax=Suillus clintonianus TaxID=1904413 RepID=UPI001B88295C|nr:uncharacterized protein DEU56DRAFT_822542 [Suillus clintonianus]KAG2126269.1 hypothetical protein DEU56DRAFT_822542 [Suillus clintonianus]